MISRDLGEIGAAGIVFRFINSKRFFISSTIDLLAVSHKIMRIGDFIYIFCDHKNGLSPLTWPIPNVNYITHEAIFFIVCAVNGFGF